MVPFDQEMMTTSWRDYITEILVKRHHAIHLVAGHDHHFGHKNQGSPELLMQTCAELGLGCDIIPKGGTGRHHCQLLLYPAACGVGSGGAGAPLSGAPPTPLPALSAMAGALARPAFSQPPTSLIPSHVLVPSHGVYVTRVTLPDGSAYPAVTNVGTRPTVDNGTDVTVEACLLDFDGDLYGETLRLEFFRHIRDEIRFDSLEALKSQIAADAETTRQAFLSGEFGGSSKLSVVNHYRADTVCPPGNDLLAQNSSILVLSRPGTLPNLARLRKLIVKSGHRSTFSRFAAIYPASCLALSAAEVLVPRQIASADAMFCDDFPSLCGT